MEHEEHIEEYLRICKAIFTRMERENSWPWVVDPEGWAAFAAEQATEATTVG
jgi:hypothetical protein